MPVSRPVCGQERREHVGEWSEGQKEEKHRFFSPIPADFRRIYFKAGISAAVTSARNSGLRPEYGRFRMVLSESDENDDRLRF